MNHNLILEQQELLNSTHFVKFINLTFSVMGYALDLPDFFNITFNIGILRIGALPFVSYLLIVDSVFLYCLPLVVMVDVYNVEMRRINSDPRSRLPDRSYVVGEDIYLYHLYWWNN